MIALNIKHPAETRAYQYPNLNSLIFGSWGFKRKEQDEQARISEARRQAITKLPPDDLLKSSPLNFEIKYQEIDSVQIRRGLIETKLKFTIGNTGQVLRRRDFTIKKQLIPETKQLLDKVLKNKIHE